MQNSTRLRREKSVLSGSPSLNRTARRFLLGANIRRIQQAASFLVKRLSPTPIGGVRCRGNRDRSGNNGRGKHQSDNVTFHFKTRLEDSWEGRVGFSLVSSGTAKQMAALMNR